MKNADCISSELRQAGLTAIDQKIHRVNGNSMRIGFQSFEVFQNGPPYWSLFFRQRSTVLPNFSSDKSSCSSEKGPR